ncbi:hypothetical protein ACFOGI_15075 [Virgibacillus xinjiangensis]|uniref:Uncharacterized protein n=1 Tax=Virgibacillus xinjiangensis TaxID=393090 RepID=A0ABV7CZ30_9BACI
MEHIQQVLEDKINLELIRLYAIGVKSKNLFYKDAAVTEEKDSYILEFKQFPSLNTWDQGNKKVSIDRHTGVVHIYYYDIDGENWSKGWYSHIPQLTIELDALIEKMPSLIMEELIEENEWYRTETKRMKGENKELSQTLKDSREGYDKRKVTYYDSGFEAGKRLYRIPIISGIKVRILNKLSFNN